ncbi:cuticle protein 19.8-like [Homarus americanus]|uniref:cuticle protein 19.8-like n=1 Tax=Homarus americanus TaxID=6706 RepID=UPI001C47B3F8|nr:cuticle protein 19.8-like [Homarus americanus]
MMRALMLTVLVGCCAASPLKQQSWPTAYILTESVSPSVVRLPLTDLQLSLPQLTSVSYHPVPAAVPVPVVQAAVPVPIVQAAVPVPVVKAAVPVVVAAAPEPMLAPQPPMPSVGVPFVGGQFHAQGEAGQYTFGHWGGPNTRVETRDALGRTSGSFAYVNPDGAVHIRKYAAAPGTGFRVAASDLPLDTNVAPEDTPEVAEIKAAHANAHVNAKAMSKPSA